MERLADISSFESLSTGSSVYIHNRVDKYGRIIRDWPAPTNKGMRHPTTSDMSMGYPITTFGKVNAEYKAKKGQRNGYGTQENQGRGNTQVPPQVPRQQQAQSEINPYSEQARKGYLQSAIGLLADTIGTFRVTGLSKEQVLQIINKMMNERF